MNFQTGEILQQKSCTKPFAIFQVEPLKTTAYNYVNAGSIDNSMGLAKPPWQKLYKDEGGPFERCSDPFMLVISDIYPTFDSDQLPGSYFNPAFNGGEFSSGAGDIDVMNVAALAKKISDTEGDAGYHYIGQEALTVDGSCSPKNVTNFGDIRGLCPEEPTKQGSYYAAAVAYYGAKYDINPVAEGAQRGVYFYGRTCFAAPTHNHTHQCWHCCFS